jgi:hypothetical protein
VEGSQLTGSSFELVRELCLRAKTASPHEAVAYLDFVNQLSTQILADLQTELADRPDLHDDLQQLESSLAEMQETMMPLRKALNDLIETGEEPAVNLQ